MKMKQIPIRAKILILAILENNQRIETETMLKIVEQVTGIPIKDEGTRRCWQDRCQKFMAGIRDEHGRRMVFHVPPKASRNGVSEYIVIRSCSDKKELQAIRHRLHSCVVGLEHSISVLDAKIRFNDATRRYLDVLK